ncbi:MAG: DNA topoisomerase I subunit omega [Gammaproteobacteria bacterium]|nr:DNA topoisomerase I subunit omega [Gammaproteobacteria bacterium]|tara:strand:- start:9489 stop:12098 length:2610 start_codon:yes stop_codon:yes gene_type:complete
MAKSLVIVESPAKAKTISKYLGSEYIVESSVGHIRDLPKKASPNAKRASIPKDLSPEEKIRLKTINDRNRLIRRMGIDPDNGWKADWQIIPEKEKVIKSLKKSAKGVDHIYLATDLDREGEAIAWHLKEALGPEKYEYSRVRFNQITKSAIIDSFEDPKEIDLDLVKAYRARRFLDKVIGFELSPLLWKKIARGLSAGRVQSVALRLLDERERLIQEFIPEEFWEVSMVLNKDDLSIPFLLNRKKSQPLLKKEEAMKIQDLIKSSEISIDEIIKKPVKIKPRAPFITSTLQQAASTKLSFTVKRTMRVAQKLYEAGHITYMRTDAPSLSKESIQDARNFIGERVGEKYLTNAPRIYSSTENAQEAHEAVRPTNAYLTADDLMNHTEEEKRLYQLIWQQYISSQMPDAEYLSTSAKINMGEYTFTAKGREIVFDGYTKISQPFKSDDDILPPLEEGEILTLNEVNLDQKFTKPPARFSEAALVKELEKKGIGRPSTYANIISTIQDRGYVEIQNRRFFVKKIGHIVAERLIESFDDIMDYEFTANLENNLDSVARGELNWRNVLDDFYNSFQKDLVSASEENGMRGNRPTSTDITCTCGKTNMVIRNSSNGVFLGCSGYQNVGDDKCKETLNLVSGDEAISIDDTEEATNLLIKKRCPRCGTSMDNYLIDENRKLHVCGKNPDCDGYLIEEGLFKIKGYDGPTLECHKCGSEMQLKTGRFGKYFGCLNDNCGATRALQRNGEPKPITMEPIELKNLKCVKCEDHYLLRDSMKGLFLAASQYPKNRETRAPKVHEINKLNLEINEACRFLPNKDKHTYLLSAPEKDIDGNEYVIRYNRTDDIHYVASEKDGKKTKWTAVFSDGVWKQNKKD